MFELNSDIKLNGNQVGNIFAKLTVDYSSFLEQKVAGVMTEDGIKNNDPLIIQIKSKQRDSIKFLHDLYHSLALKILQKHNSNNPQYVSLY